MEIAPFILFFAIIMAFLISSALREIRKNKENGSAEKTQDTAERDTDNAIKTPYEPVDILETNAEYSYPPDNEYLQAEKFKLETENRKIYGEQGQNNQKIVQSQGSTSGKSRDGHPIKARNRQKTIWDILIDNTENDKSTAISLTNKQFGRHLKEQHSEHKYHDQKSRNYIPKDPNSQKVHQRRKIYSKIKETSVKTAFAKNPTKKRNEKKSSANEYNKEFHFKKNPLQNAVIWSEIMSKPIALRKSIYIDDT